MLLHDSFVHSINKSIGKIIYRPITLAYSPLFNSNLTFILSICGLIFNLICSSKLWSIISQYNQRKSSSNLEQLSITPPVHILSHHKYRFLLVLSINDVLLCSAAIISCLDEKFYSQSLLARYHLCAAEILIWKFTLHFIPILILSILCRYHYILKRDFLIKPSNFSTLNQLLCTDLSILISFVLALAWSVDGLWLWGVADIKDLLIPLTGIENQTNSIVDDNSQRNLTKLLIENNIAEYNGHLYLPVQTTICYLQTNHNIDFTVRLFYLIQADFLLLISLHLLALFLEVCLHIRLCCCVIIKRMNSTFNHERQLCIYVLYIFILITFTSLPFYFYRITEIIFDTQLTAISNEFINSRVFAQILLMGICFKPLLILILFFPSSNLFKLKCYLKCYSPVHKSAREQSNTIFQSGTEHDIQQVNDSHSKRNFYSIFARSPLRSIMRSKIRRPQPPSSATTTTTVMMPTSNQQQSSILKTEQLNSWLQLTNSFMNDNTKDAADIEFV